MGDFVAYLTIPGTYRKRLAGDFFDNLSSNCNFYYLERFGR
jgi:hypothetical protein